MPGDFAETMARDGCVVLPAFATPVEVAALRAAITSLTPLPGTPDHEAFSDAPHVYPPLRGSARFLNAFNRAPVFVPWLERFAPYAELTVGANCRVIGQTAWRSPQGHDGTILHVDTRWPPRLCTAHLYLSDTADGCAPTLVARGTHANAPKPPVEALEALELRAGDALVFRSDLWHSGSANTSGRDRYLLQVHYGERSAAPHFHPALTWQFAPHVLEAAERSPLLRRLLGEYPYGAYD